MSKGEVELKGKEVFRERISFELLILNMLRDIWVAFTNVRWWFEGEAYPLFINDLETVDRMLNVLISFLEGVEELKEDIRKEIHENKELKELYEKYEEEFENAGNVDSPYMVQREELYRDNLMESGDTYAQYIARKIKAIISILDKHDLLLREREFYRGAEIQ